LRKALQKSIFRSNGTHKRLANGFAIGQHLLSRSSPQDRLTPSGPLSRRQERAKGGRARAEKTRRRKELRERFEVDELEDLADADLGLLDRALVRLALLVSSDDHRVALRACKEVFDRVLGRPRLGPDVVEHDYQADIERAHEKLDILIERRARAIADSRASRPMDADSSQSS
jgi:hypothetical protein